MIGRLYTVLLLWTTICLCGAGPSRLIIGTNDVVAWVGGSDVASAVDGAHLETLLALQFPGVRFRNFGWEGDTVFSQPRDVGFPPLIDHLTNAGATIVLLQFGRAETLGGKVPGEAFGAACERMGTNLASRGIRLVWIAPAPFEPGSKPLPNLAMKNELLEKRVAIVSSLCARHEWTFVNAFADLRRDFPSERFGQETAGRRTLTVDGLQLSAYGHARFALAVMQQLGFSEVAQRAEQPFPSGAWSNSTVEQLRQLAIEKNRLWVNYWRPHNWAFLGGDRTSQPSSRDHRDPRVRWFPDEMRRYLPLIEEKDTEIMKAARSE